MYAYTSVEIFKFKDLLNLEIRQQHGQWPSTNLSSRMLCAAHLDFSNRDFLQNWKLLCKLYPKEIRYEAWTIFKMPFWHSLAPDLVLISKIDLYRVCLHAHHALEAALDFRYYCLCWSVPPSPSPLLHRQSRTPMLLPVLVGARVALKLNLPAVNELIRSGSLIYSRLCIKSHVYATILSSRLVGHHSRRAGTQDLEVRYNRRLLDWPLRRLNIGSTS